MNYILKQTISLVLLVSFYLLTNVDFRDWQNTTILQKSYHLLRLAPFTAGATLLTVAFFNRQNAEKMKWYKILRIYCTIGILMGLFFGLYYYVSMPPVG